MAAADACCVLSQEVKRSVWRGEKLVFGWRYCSIPWRLCATYLYCINLHFAIFFNPDVFLASSHQYAQTITKTPKDGHYFGNYPDSLGLRDHEKVSSRVEAEVVSSQRKLPDLQMRESLHPHDFSCPSTQLPTDAIRDSAGSSASIERAAGSFESI